MSGSNMFKILEDIAARQDEVFFGTITDDSDVADDGVERDGGGKKFFAKLVPSVFKRRRSMNVIGHLDENTVVVNEFTQESGSSTLKFYYKTKIMEAVDGGVYLRTVNTPTTPEAAKFIKDRCEDNFCDKSLLKNEIESTYVVLHFEDKQLRSVNEDQIKDSAEYYSLITIYETHAPPGNPDTAIYFPAQEEKKYHYYLVPQDSSHAKSTIMVNKICVEKLTEDQIKEINHRYLAFTQKFDNHGDEKKGRGGASFDAKGLHIGKSPPAKYQLSSDVEKD